MVEWDNKNRPIGYILGASPGFSEFVGYGEPSDAKLTNMGFARKIMKASRMGFQFAMIDFESLSEAYEPEIKKQVDIVKNTQHIDIGVHLPTDMDLCLADAFQWMNMQRQLVLGAKTAKETLSARFMLFHSSSVPRPNLTPVSGERQAPSKMASYNGMNFAAWIESVSNDDFNLKQWFIAKFVRVMYSAMGSPPNVEVVKYFDTIDNFNEETSRINKIFENAENNVKKKRIDYISKLTNIENKISEKNSALGKIDEKNEKYQEKLDELVSIRKEYEKYKNKYDELNIDTLGNLKKEIGEEFDKIIGIYRLINGIDMNAVFDYWKQHGSEAEEYVIYHATAKWMWKNKDKLYKTLVDDQTDPDIIIKKANQSTGKNEKYFNTIKQIISAVAAKYMEGHLTSKGDYGIRSGDQVISVLDYVKKNNIHTFIETNMPPKGHAGELRIMKATDQIKIVKTIDPENLSYCMYFEHLTVNFIDPTDECKEIMKKMPGDAKYIRCLHINAPRPIPGAHSPIDLLSNDMAILYEQIYNLRKAGMKDSYFIWEMGSYGSRESAVAFRNIVEQLDKNTDPKKLPPEFFGIDDNFKAAQTIAINQHAFDPLKGMLNVPEEDHGFLSGKMIEKNKLAEWKKEELK